MSSFLANFMQFSLKVTSAQRALAVDSALNAVSTEGVDEKVLGSSSFTEFAAQVLSDALKAGAAVITNNIITDPSQAPKTNTSFSDLRIVVAFPVGSLGAIYLDRPVKMGVISRDQVDRLIAFSRQLVADGQTHLSVEDMMQRYGATQ
jgi:hypothetical protein